MRAKLTTLQLRDRLVKAALQWEMARRSITHSESEVFPGRFHELATDAEFERIEHRLKGLQRATERLARRLSEGKP